MSPLGRRSSAIVTSSRRGHRFQTPQSTSAQLCERAERGPAASSAPCARSIGLVGRCPTAQTPR